MDTRKRSIAHLFAWTTSFLCFAALLLAFHSRPSLVPIDRYEDETSVLSHSDPESKETPFTSLAGTKSAIYGPPQPGKYLNWTFRPEDHAEDFGLDPEQCASAFPGLFQDIQRASRFWQDSKITFEDVDTSWKPFGLVKAMIYGRSLRVLEAKFSGDGYHVHRAIAILGSIHRAITSYNGHLPDIEFSFSVDDIADPEDQANNRPIWTFSRRSKDKSYWLMPDFGFWSWDLDVVGEYTQIRDQISRNERPFAQKIQRAFWRGAENTQVRSELLEAAKPFSSEWADISAIKWSSRTKLSSGSQGNAIPISEHCKWQFLVQTEGVSYSGRGKYLFNCHSVVIAHRLEWIENWHHLLVSDGPDQNFVLVERDFSNLANTMHDLLRRPSHAERIANNSVAAFRDRYLTPAAQACYWREMFRAWSLISFKPEPWVEVPSFNSAGQVASTVKQRRGIPYETFMLTVFDAMHDNCGWLRKLVGKC